MQAGERRPVSECNQRMSVNHFLGNKKRNSSILYHVDQAKVTTSPSSLQRATNQSHVGNHGEGFPPNKRYKSFAAAECKEMEDPFADSDDFTADDLEEIDIIATQAMAEKVSFETNTWRTGQNTELSSIVNSTFKVPNHMKPWNIAHTAETTSACQFGRSREEAPPKDKFKIETLQAQYEEAKKKLKEMQDEILTKNGEIKILRDSMQQMKSSLEEQQKSYMEMEKEKLQISSEKEKEFSRK
ncbi:ATR-interacting protein, partial [Varanus komodoensis]